MRLARGDSVVINTHLRKLLHVDPPAGQKTWIKHNTFVVDDDQDLGTMLCVECGGKAATQGEADVSHSD
jgi:hypothetical protein